MNEDMIKIEEVARRIDTSVQTINNWYRFAKQEPKNEFAAMLPSFYQEKPRSVRYWRTGDIKAIQAFKDNIPKGRNGILGNVTQKGARAKKLGGQYQYITEITGIMSAHHVEKSVVDEVEYLLYREAGIEKPQMPKCGEHMIRHCGCDLETDSREKLLIEVFGKGHAPMSAEFEQVFTEFKERLQKENYRIVLTEMYENGKTVKEISTLLNYSTQRVYQIRQIIRRRIRDPYWSRRMMKKAS